MKRCVLIIVLLLLFFSSFAQNEQEAEKYYGLAVNAFTSNNLAKSLELFRKCDSLRTKAPDYVGITANTDHWLGYVYYRLGKHEQALQQSMYYYQIPPEDYRKHVEMLSVELQAISSKAVRDYHTAIKLNKLCLEQYAANLGKDHYFVGNTYFEMANLAQNVAEEKENVLTYFDKGIACFASMGEKGKAAMQFFTISKCFYLQQNLRYEEASKCLPAKDEVFSQHKAIWYLLNCNYEASVGNYEQINNLVSEFKNDTDCCNDTIYYQYIQQLDIASYSARGMRNECADKGLKFLGYLEKKHGSASIEYLEYSLFVGDYLRNAGRLMEETLLYLKSFQTADSSFYMSFNNAIEEPNVAHPLLRVMGQMLARLISASKLMGMSIGHIDFCEKAKSILDTLDWTKRKDSPDYQSLLDIYGFSVKELADEFQKKGNPKEGIKYYEDALAIPAIKESAWAHSFMQNCAILYYQEKDYKRSINYFEKSYDPENQGNGTEEGNLMVAYAYAYPDSPRVAELDSISFAKHHNSVISTLLSTSNGDREFLWNNQYRANNNGFAIFANMCKGNNSAVNTIAYNALLLGRGFLLCAQSDMQKAFSSTADTKLLQIRHRINEIESVLSSYQDNSQKWMELFSEQKRLESVIAQELSQNTQLKDSYTTTTEDVQRNLGKKSLAVEFAYLQDNILSANQSYYAFLLRQDWSSPRLIKLDLSQDFFTADDFYTNSEKTSMMWDEICKVGHVAKGDTIYFSADRDIHASNIENMHLKNGKLISEIYNIIRLSSTRELNRKRTTAFSIPNAVLYGGLDYAESSKTPTSNANKNRGADTGLPPLPYTKKEIEDIGYILNEAATAANVTCYSGHEGTEHTFRSLSGHAPAILHLATHGAFLEPGQSTTGRSALYLSGSEPAYYGETDADAASDGVLYASELGDMDLSKTDLVVMSACNSALGTIAPDGVFGLQRGFKIAGVKSILMSLWPVDDEATCKLMTEFYSNWITRKMTKHDALEAAKKTVRETPGWEDPQYWAAFILLDGLD